MHFDHPTDTWLPGGKIRYNKLTNEKIILTSQRIFDDLTPEMFTFEIEKNGTSLLLIWKGSIGWIGYWTGKSFRGYLRKKVGQIY